MPFEIPLTNDKLTTYNRLKLEMTANPQKYDFTSTELQDLKPRYNNTGDGLERDNQLYLEEENKLFHAAIITMTTLLFASIYISANR